MKNGLIGKDPDPGKDWRQEEKGTTEDEMLWWHHPLHGHEFEQTLGAGDGQESLACVRPQGHRVRHDWVTELNILKEEHWIVKALVSPNLYIALLIHNVSKKTFKVTLDSVRKPIFWAITAYRILVPLPGVEPETQHWKPRVLTSGLPEMS